MRLGLPTPATRHVAMQDGARLGPCWGRSAFLSSPESLTAWPGRTAAWPAAPGSRPRGFPATFEGAASVKIAASGATPVNEGSPMANAELLAALLGGFRPDPASSRPVAVQKALVVARRLQQRARSLQTPAERRQQAELDRLLQTPSDKATLALMTDQAFRTGDPARAVEHLTHILDVQGVPRFFGPLDRTLMKGFQSFGGYMPGVALPLVKEHMHKETANVILPGEHEVLTRHLDERRAEGLRMNVNFLGEAILSEDEAERRLQQYLQGLQWPQIEVVSIKISTLYSQISPLARRTLDRRGLEQVRAGIALQSYIPDSHRTLLELQRWARARVAAGGGRVTVRLVKGANMESERAESSVRGWPQAPYRSKLETDANYKRMVHAVMRPENLAAMDVGIASHNLFDLAYGLVLAHERDALQRVQFEMLEGMANAQRRALFELSRNLLLYAPACRRENFINAIGYLIRRLDENTGPENFLRHAFRIEVDSPEWRTLEQGFLAAFDAIDGTSDAPRRDQDRNLPPRAVPAVARGWQHFENEPDTDFALPHNGRWGERIVEQWCRRCGEDAAAVPLVIAGEELLADRPVGDCLDPSRPGVIVGRYRQATGADVARAVECAADDADGWRTLSVQARFDILGKVAQELRVARGDLMGAALADGGKTLMESDPEVSEAIDFVEFYRDTARWWQQLPTLEARPKGVVVVVPPWNFPIAIACGGVAAALAAGNTVIIKPASDTVLVAWVMCQSFWRAGVSRRTLQFVPCAGGREGRRLVNHPRVDAVILTGGTETARTMLGDNPRLNLFAETGGKDATIVTAVSDRELAIKHILHSAFSHSGQKCSATSLLLLQAEVYDDPGFRRGLCEAVQSLKVGSAWDLETKMGPMIRPPSGDLETALKVLEPGEEWALMPQPVEGNPCLWTPGVKYGVRPGSYTHMTEFFGPLLAVMRFEKLSEAVALVNQTGYGLTSGLESLDEREWDYWKGHVRAGNLYINRVTTGAVVLRQPFGGMGKSGFGPGMKAGGPNYVAQFMDFVDRAVGGAGGRPASPTLAALCAGLRAQPAADDDRIVAAAASYERNQREEFGAEHDHFRLVGQDNVRRYLPVGSVRVRVAAPDSAFDIFARACAAHVAGCPVVVSTPPGLDSAAVRRLEQLTEPWAGAIEFVEESDAQLAEAIGAGQVDRVRYAAPDRAPLEVLRAGNAANGCVVRGPVSAEGRLELLWYLREQSISTDYHRYGNLGVRADEPRAAVP